MAPQVDDSIGVYVGAMTNLILIAILFGVFKTYMLVKQMMEVNRQNRVWSPTDPDRRCICGMKHEPGVCDGGR